MQVTAATTDEEIRKLAAKFEYNAGIKPLASLYEYVMKLERRITQLESKEKK